METVENNNVVQAVVLAKDQGLPEAQIRESQQRSLWETAAVNRNAIATKILAGEYGLSKEDLRRLLQELAQQKQEGEAKGKSLKPRYDYTTNRYLDLDQWLEQFFAMWSSFPDR